MSILSEKWVNTRKAHRCFGCLRKFDRGIEMRRQTNVNDGELYTVYSCKTCDTLMSQFKDLFFNDAEHLFLQGCIQDGYDFKAGIDSPEELLIKLTNDRQLQ